MLEVGDYLGFMLEATDKCWIPGKMAGKNLQCHVTIHPWLIGFLDSRHPAFANSFNNAILTELLSG
jgi:hypothetical protein